MHLLSNLKAILQVKADKNKEDNRLIMQLSPIYEQDLAEATQRGVQQERRMTVESFLIAKFGSLDPELMAIIQPIVDLPSSEYSTLMFQFFNLSREDLLARFNSEN
jgi:hypothetical protein